MRDRLKIGVVCKNTIPNWILRLLILLKKDELLKDINFYLLDNSTSKNVKNANIFLKLYITLDKIVNKKYNYKSLYNLNETRHKLTKENITINEYRGFEGTEENDLIIWLDNSIPIPDSIRSARFGVWFTNLNYNSLYNLTILFSTVLNKDTFPFLLSIDKTKTFDIYSSCYRHYDKSYIKTLHKFEENIVNVFHSKLLSLSKGNKIEELATNYKSTDENISRQKKNDSSLKALRLLLLFFFDKFRNIVFKEQWFIVLIFRKSGITKAYKYISSSDKFWADPFLLTKDNKNYLFYEEYEDNKEKGNISCIELDNSNIVKENPQIIIENSYHFSYPFIFEFENETYMIPETSENKSIELYKAVTFPDKWEKVKNIMDNVFALDSTLFFHDNLWWMFTNFKNTKSASSDSDLHLFFSNNPIKDNWVAHPKNPIVTNIKTARPAGKIFKKEGKLYRPSQDCSKRYGYGIVINEIEVMSTTEYKEKVIESITPKKNNIIALHTINFNDDKSIVVFDAMKRINKFFFRKSKNLVIEEIQLNEDSPFNRLLKHL